MTRRDESWTTSTAISGNRPNDAPEASAPVCQAGGSSGPESSGMTAPIRRTRSPLGCGAAGRRPTRRAFLAAGAAGLFSLAFGAAGCSSGTGGDASARDAVASSAPDVSEASDASSAGDAEPVSRAFFAFDSLVSVKAYGADEALLDEIQQMCERYDDLFSAHSETSDVGRVNAAGGEPVEVDQDTADLIEDALELCEEFDGLFDVTIGAVSLLWDFDEGVRPADAEIEAALPHVDWRGVSVEGTTVTLSDPSAKLDLGGVAKGWICERLVERLREAGVDSGIISLGTSSDYALGAKPDGTSWGIGLRDPSGSVADLMAKVSLSETSITSSGLYDRHFEQDGVDYWHILDPATGYPVETDLLGVMVIGPSSTEGDAMSTALFVLGDAETAIAWLAEHAPEVGAMFVGSDGSVAFTDGFEEAYAYEELSGE